MYVLSVNSPIYAYYLLNRCGKPSGRSKELKTKIHVLRSYPVALVVVIVVTVVIVLPPHVKGAKPCTTVYLYVLADCALSSGAYATR